MKALLSAKSSARCTAGSFINASFFKAAFYKASFIRALFIRSSFTLGAIGLAAFVLATGMTGLEAQTRNAQAQAHPDLMSTLLELDRTAAATNSDIGHLEIDRWKGGWKTGWTTSSTHKDQAAKAAASLQRNLKGALPDLIREAINQHGSMTATFKVYEDLNLVCETLDSLVDTAQQFGKKEESIPLSNDFGTLIRLRRTMSAYIKERAVAADGGSNGQPTYTTFAPSTSSSSDVEAPRKIVIDDDVPDKKTAAKKKKSTIQFNNVE
jgi:hypothetical protein